MTVDELVSDLETKIERSKSAVKRTLAMAESMGRTRLTAEEDDACERLLADAEANMERLKRAKAVQAEEAESESQMQATHRTPAADKASGITATEREYRLDKPDSRAEALSEPERWIDAQTGQRAALARGERFGDHPVMQELAARNRERDEIILAQHGSLAHQIRALTPGSGSNLLPTSFSSSIIEIVRNKTVLNGATVIPMPARTVHIGKQTQDVTPAWRTEGGTVTASDPGFGFVQLTAKSIAALCVSSYEFLADAPNASAVIQNSIGAALALQVDKYGLYGGLDSANDSNLPGITLTDGPTGLYKALMTSAPGNLLGGSATNGTAQSSTNFYKEVGQTIYSVKKRNENPNWLASSDALREEYDLAVNSLGDAVTPPRAVTSVPWHTSNALASYTRGTLTTAADLFCGDLGQLLMGVRQGIEVRVLSERYAEAGEVGFIAFMRVDFAVARDSAFSIYQALTAAA